MLATWTWYMQAPDSDEKEAFNTVECFIIEKQNKLIEADQKGIVQRKIDIGGKIVDF